MRVLMVPMAWGSGWGPIMNMIGLSEALQDRGATVAFALGERAASVVARGRYGSLFSTPEPRPSAAQATEFLERRGVDEEYLTAAVMSELSAIDSFKPDVLVTDLQLTSIISATHRTLPHVAVARWTEHSSFESPIFAAQRGDPHLPPTRTQVAFDHVLVKYHQPPIRVHPLELAFERSAIRLVPSSRTIEHELAWRDNYDFVGYLDAPTSRSWPNSDTSVERERVLCYLSRKSYRWNDVLPALEHLGTTRPVSVVLVDPSLEADKTMAGIQLRRFLSPLPVLAADVVVTTGTRGVSQQALTAGAGLVILNSPDDEELDFTARRLAELEVATLTDASPSQFVVAFENARSPISRSRSNEVGAELLECGGPARAVDLILSLS